MPCACAVELDDVFQIGIGVDVLPDALGDIGKFALYVVRVAQVAVDGLGHLFPANVRALVAEQLRRCAFLPFGHVALRVQPGEILGQGLFNAFCRDVPGDFMDQVADFMAPRAVFPKIRQRFQYVDVTGCRVECAYGVLRE